ncbi:exodeoxyribonuclease VII large subunit [Humidisolicoccus flavus]|uniref:exodeoxyribonuclease VII large subunit n=1 Tax=Humidisolicoccus flavus TaxID=3111414 RepID=UPI00324DA186
MTGKITGSPEEAWPVARLSETLREYIARLGAVWVEGELAQWNDSRGNIYGKLKDLEADATVSINVWQSVKRSFDEDFSQGDRVVALVKPDYWVRGGSLSMNVTALRHVGLGDLLARIERLRAQLQSEGLFDESLKQRLPFLPGTIGLITGANSDAEKDVLRNAQMRWPGVQFRTEHAAVQGDNAVPTVLRALEILDTDPEVEVIIIARGGGDFQNLLPFSDERLVRAVAAASTPVVSAIGHEADRPLLDEVADLRASTPTDAAKRVVPDVADELARINQARSHIRSRMTSIVQNEISRLEQFRTRPVLATPHTLIDTRTAEIATLVARADTLVERQVDRARGELSALIGSVRALSPQATLDRGYAVVQAADGTVVRTPKSVRAQETLTVTLAEGSLFTSALESDAPSGGSSSAADSNAADSNAADSNAADSNAADSNAVKRASSKKK